MPCLHAQLKKLDETVKSTVAASVLPQLPIEPVLPAKEEPVTVVEGPAPAGSV